MIIEQAVDGKVIHRFSSDYSQVEFMLNDGSHMRVCICTQCQSELDMHDVKVHELIMEAVVNGWQLEVNSLVEDQTRLDWDHERGRKHMEEYCKRKILIPTAGVAKHVLDGHKRKIEKMMLDNKGIEDGISQ